MAFDPLDKRPLYQKVIDEITAQIAAGTLKAHERVPSANEIAQRYEVASMTAQRALRELQQRGVVYGVAGKGNFVHPDAPVLLKPIETDIQTPEQYVEVRDQILADMDAARERFNVEFAAAEAADDLEALVAVKEAYEGRVGRALSRLGDLTMYHHQMRFRGVELEPESSRRPKNGNRPREVLSAQPSQDVDDPQS